MARNAKGFDERRARPGEIVGGGFFVFRRGRSTGRIKVPSVPFEFGSIAEAGAEAQRRERSGDGAIFDIFERVGTVPASGGPVITVLGVEISLTAFTASYLVEHGVARKVDGGRLELDDGIDLSSNEKVHRLMLALCHPRALERRP